MDPPMNFHLCNVVPLSDNQEVSLQNEMAENEVISQVDLSVIQSEPILFLLQCNTEEVISNNNISDENNGEDNLNQILISNDISNDFNKEDGHTLFISQPCNNMGNKVIMKDGAEIDSIVENNATNQRDSETLAARNDSNNEENIETNNSNKKKRNICEICNYVTSHHRDFIRHLRKHTGEKPYECHICNKKFSRQDKLMVHKHVHFEDKRFKCQLCDYATSDGGALRMHHRIHTDERPYKCQMCPYQAKSSSHLVTHLRTHTGDTPYFCKVATCGLAFKTSTNLKRHMKVHKFVSTSPTHSNLNDIPEKFSGKSTCKVAKLVTKPPTCYICHNFLHKGGRRKKRKRRAICARCSKDHKCPHCDAAFVRADSLRSHVRLHRLPSPPPALPTTDEEDRPSELSDPAYPVLLYLDTADYLSDSLADTSPPLFVTDNSFL